MAGYAAGSGKTYEGVMNIAVTGGIGSGKSSVSRVLARAVAARLQDSDEICRQEMAPGRRGLLELERRWGQRFLDTTGALDRTALRQAALAEPKLLDELEEILHPVVYQRLCEAIDEGKSDGRWLVAEVPLLFEVGWENIFDCVVAVRGGLQQVIARVERRDRRSKEEILQLVAAQMPVGEKVEKADYCIDNSGSFTITVEQVYWLARSLRRSAGSG